MPSVLCVAPACKEIVRDGGSRCEKHRKKMTKERTENRKFYGGRRNSHIYDSARWRRLSIKKRTVNPFCEVCEKNGIMNSADVVDHIIEIEDGGGAFKWDNLMSMCHHHHNEKTQREKRKRQRRTNL